MPRFCLPPLWLRPIVIVVLILGIFFRFANIDQKVFWHDEAATALYISGYDLPQAKAQIFTGQVLDIEALQKFQKIDPNKSVIDTITSLATYNSHHPPLYYVITRIWAQLFGDSVTSLRMPSIIISLLVLPLAYWFCEELFHSNLVAWLAVVFFAISPFQILYAQEAREYSLGMVMALLVNLTLLYVLRRPSINNWIVYSFSLAASYYTSIFSIFIAINQGIYTLIQNKFKPNQVTINHFIAGLSSLILFAPWLWVIIKYKDVVDHGTRWRTSKPFIWESMIQLWSLNVSTNFVDISSDLKHPSNYIFPLVYTVLLVYAVYFLIKTTDQKIWLWLLSLLICPVLYLIIPDIIMGTVISAVGRYFIPWYTAIPIVFAYLISQKISQDKVGKQLIWRGIFLVTITLSIISCAIIYQSEYWWNKGSLGSSVFQGAKIINQVEKPLIITDPNCCNFRDILSLSHRVKQQTKFQLVPTPEIPIIPSGFSNIFLMTPSDSLINKFQVKYGIEAIKSFEGTTLLELKLPTATTNK